MTWHSASLPVLTLLYFVILKLYCRLEIHILDHRASTFFIPRYSVILPESILRNRVQHLMLRALVYHNVLQQLVSPKVVSILSFQSNFDENKTIIVMF